MLWRWPNTKHETEKGCDCDWAGRMGVIRGPTWAVVGDMKLGGRCVEVKVKVKVKGVPYNNVLGQGVGRCLFQRWVNKGGGVSEWWIGWGVSTVTWWLIQSGAPVDCESDCESESESESGLIHGYEWSVFHFPFFVFCYSILFSFCRSSSHGSLHIYSRPGTARLGWAPYQLPSPRCGVTRRAKCDPFEHHCST